MKTILKSIFILSLLLSACGPDHLVDEAQPVPENEIDHNEALQVGGLYLIKNSEGTYYVTKILVIDDFAVHLRTYANKFTEPPKDISSASLKVLIGHAPIDKKGFMIDNPELLKVETVLEEELEGYKMYMEEMKKQK